MTRSTPRYPTPAAVPSRATVDDPHAAMHPRDVVALMRRPRLADGFAYTHPGE